MIGMIRGRQSRRATRRATTQAHAVIDGLEPDVVTLASPAREPLTLTLRQGPLSSMAATRYWMVLLALVRPGVLRAQATLSYAYGANWNAPDAHRDMLIFEYYNAWRTGDSYIYFETQNLATTRKAGTSVGTGETTPYGEAHLRMRVGDVLGSTVLGAVQVDAGEADVVALTGASVTWRAAGRTLINTDVFLRYDPTVRGVTWQFVGYGEWAFHVGPAPMTYGGYIKFVGRPTFMVSDTRLLFVPAKRVGFGVAVRAQYQGAVPEAVVQWRF